MNRPPRIHVLLLGFVALASMSASAGAAPARAGTEPADSLAIARGWMDLGEYARIERVARSALGRMESASSPPESVGTALDLLVEARWRQGYATSPESERLAMRALALRDTSAASLDSAAGIALINLGTIRLQSGDLASASLLFGRAYAIRTRHPGRDSLDYVWALGGLSQLALQTGDLERACLLLQEMLWVRQRHLGAMHPIVAWSWSNLASAHQAAGDFVRAKEEFETCVRIRSRSLPQDHPDQARGLKDLANVLFALGDYPEARSLFDQSLRMRIRTLGPDAPEVANGLGSLSAVMRRMGDLRGARDAAERALQIRRHAFDAGNPEIATSLLQVGLLLAESGDPAAGADSIGRALRIREEVFGRDHPVTALALDGLAQTLLLSAHADSAIALARRAIAAKSAGLGAGHPDVAHSWETLAEALEIAGRHEAALDAALECERVSREHLVRNIGRLSERQALQYASVRTSGLDLAVRLAARPDATAGMKRRAWDAVTRSRERVLEEVSRRLRSVTGAETGLTPVLASVPRGAALVAYSLCESDEFPVRRPAEYIAFIGLPGESLQVIALGRATAIDSVVQSWRGSIRNRTNAVKLRQLGSTVRAQIWDPVARRIGSNRRVIVIPDGSINRVSFYALPSPGGGYLVEQPRVIETVSSERRLVGHDTRRGSGLLVAVGGVQYEGALSTLFAYSRGGSTYAPLRHSGTEAHTIAALWNPDGNVKRRATVMGGREATVHNLIANARTAEVLHIATHGVFAGEGIDPVQQLRLGAKSRLSTLTVLTESGLVLAPDRDSRDESQRKGFLSAAEAMKIDLRGTRWVVLSGCETGASSSVGRAGWLGLRSAFECAGARVVIMSLWPVDDLWAQMWMRNLYRERYVRGRTTGEAVREASRQLLNERRSLGLPDDPATWAAFVASGVDD